MQAAMLWHQDLLARKLCKSHRKRPHLAGSHSADVASSVIVQFQKEQLAIGAAAHRIAAQEPRLELMPHRLPGYLQHTQEVISENADLFSLGVDSVASVHIRESIHNKLLPDKSDSLPLNVVYDCGTIKIVVVRDDMRRDDLHLCLRKIESCAHLTR